MRDRVWILNGIVVFLILALFPVWYSAAAGGTGAVPDPVVAPDLVKSRPCVEPKEWMRVHHMELLDEWRNAVVRDGEREWRSSDGRKFRMSLTGTCMDCHDNKTSFCDRCHDYADVNPYCFDCHLENPGRTGGN